MHRKQCYILYYLIGKHAITVLTIPQIISKCANLPSCLGLLRDAVLTNTTIQFAEAVNTMSTFLNTLRVQSFQGQQSFPLNV